MKTQARTRGIVGKVATVAAVSLAAGLAAQASAAVVTVCPTVETAAVHNPTTPGWDALSDSAKKLDANFDAVDDAAIWIHPSDPSKSLIINSDKSDGGGYNLYNLDGSEQVWAPSGRFNNVDIRYNFPLGSAKVALVGFTDRATKPYRLVFYKVNPATRTMTQVGTPAISTHQTIMPRGFAMYHSPNTGKYYAFVTDSGKTDQYEIDGSTGTVTLKLVRELPKTATSSEGLVADDEKAFLYLAEEKNTSDPASTVGHIWRFNADPAASGTPTQIAATTNGGGVLTPDIKGLTMYYAAGGKGYLIAASQGKVPGQNYSSFGVFDRATGAFKGSFALTGSGCAIDEVAGEDGIDVTNFNLGPAFPNGLFVTGDFDNKDATVLKRQNNKVVAWQTVANAFTPKLLIDNTWDPRAVGGGTTPTDTTPPSVAITSPTAGATVSATVALTATADDGSGSGVGQVDFLVDGFVVASDTTAPYSVNWNTGLYSNANHVLSAVAVDNVGNRATATSRVVRVANLLPPTNTGTKIASLALAGGAPRLLASSPAGSVRQVAYSHTRTRIAYAGPSGIVVANASGSAARVLPGTSGATHPAWGVLDRAVVFVKGGAVYSTPTAGGAVRKLAGGGVTWLAASPNGKRIAYVARQSNGKSDIWIMKADGSGRRNLTRSAAISEWQPTWITTTTVAFARTVSGKWTIFRKPANGGLTTRVTAPALNCRQPAYSPDATKLACVSIGAASNKLRVLKASGTGVRQLAVTTTRPVEPAWASNGAVAYTTN